MVAILPQLAMKGMAESSAFGATSVLIMVNGVELYLKGWKPPGRRLVAISRWPGISHLARLGYHLFARNRLRLTGRCLDDRCAIPAPRAAAPVAVAPPLN